MKDLEKKKKILILSTAYYPFVGGAEVAIKEISKRINQYDFYLLTAKLNKNLKPEEKVENINVIRLGVGNIFFDKLLLPIRGLLFLLNNRDKYDFAWGMMVSYATISVYLYNFLSNFIFKKRLPVVLTLQEGDSETHLKFKWFGLINLSWYLTLKNTDTLTAISNFLLNRAKSMGYKGKSFLIPNGVDVEVFGKKYTKEEVDLIKKSLEKKEEDVFIVTTSRLTHKNAVDDIIKSLNYLSPNIKLVVIGVGEEGINLKKLVDQNNLKDRVQFLGFVEYNKIPIYLNACDIFVRPSRSEGFGNSFIEAMAVGLPVVATPVGGIPDFLEDRVTGMFCNPDNPKSISMAIESILKDEHLKNILKENSQKRVIENYNWDNISIMMNNVFDNMI